MTKDFAINYYKCRDCGRQYEIYAASQDIRRWQEGELIQNAMPYLDADDRELLISGICGSCFSSIFAGGEDDHLEAQYEDSVGGEL